MAALAGDLSKAILGHSDAEKAFRYTRQTMNGDERICVENPVISRLTSLTHTQTE